MKCLVLFDDLHNEYCEATTDSDLRRNHIRLA